MSLPSHILFKVYHDVTDFFPVRTVHSSSFPLLLSQAVLSSTPLSEWVLLQA